MRNKNSIITGSNSGIGKVTALELAKKGANIIMVCRSEETGDQARKEIIEKSGNKNVELFTADLSNMSEIKTVAKKIKKKYPVIDILINNAGINKTKRTVTSDNFETTMAVNHLAIVLLTRLLLDQIKKSKQGRIINVSSELHRSGEVNLNDLMLEKNFGGIKAYNNSKLVNLLYTLDLAKELEKTSITVNAVHPGVVATSIAREWPTFLMNIVSLFLLSPEKGASAQISLASEDKFVITTGKYFNRHSESKPNIVALDLSLQESVVKKSHELLEKYL